MALDPQHEQKRRLLRSVGLILTAVGAIFSLVGAVDFFSSFGSFDQPDLFWMLFVGLPLFGVGLKLTGAGYLGTITRYGVSEVAPVAKDALTYLKDPSHSADDLIACGSCGTQARPDARFCDACGATLGAVCGECKTRNDADSKFCDNCGKPLTA